jgi:pimeloyl-ACP methyl ester carboxylesterase
LWRFWYQWALALPGIGPAALRIAAERNPVLLHVGSNAWDKEELDQYARQFREADRAKATTLLYRYASVQLQRNLPRYRRMHLAAPTLLLFPADDAVQKGIALGGYERSAPNMEIEVVPDTSHFIIDERPELVLDRARTFFGG